jgi:hypothetical protein
MASHHPEQNVPQELIDKGAAGLSDGGVWSFFDEQSGKETDCTTDELAHAVLSAIPDGWAKVDGEWIKVSDLLAKFADELGYMVRKAK